MKKVIFLVFCVFILARPGYGQAIGYQMKYDDPYNINKLFVHFIPIYSDVAATNMTIGYGFQIDYYHLNKFDFTFHARKSYGARTDLMRDAAEKNTGNSNTDSPNVYNMDGLGGTKHWKDLEEEKDSKVFLYSKTDKGSKWESMVVKTTTIAGKVRNIYGGRLGGMFYNTSFDMSRALSKQEATLSDASGNPIDNTAVLFGNMKSSGVYLGASMAWFRNLSVEFESKYEPGGDDLLLTTYFDILLASVQVEDIVYQSTAYSASPIDVNNIGFRLGIQGKFNRAFSWGYGAEIGYRPSVKTQSFFMLLKLSFPILGSDLKYSKIDSVKQE